MLPHTGGDGGVPFIQQSHLLQVQRGVLLRQGNDDSPQLVGQRAGAVDDALFAGMDVRKGVVHHVQKQRFLGWIDRVDCLFADVDGFSGLLHREAQPLAPEKRHTCRPEFYAQFVVFIHAFTSRKLKLSFRFPL